MKTLHRNKIRIYLCQVYQDGSLKKYKEPIELRENFHIMNSDADLIAMGKDAYIHARIRSSVNHYDLYHLGDRLYVYNELPEKHDALCKKADYEVCANPVKSLNECDILLKNIGGNIGKLN